MSTDFIISTHPQAVIRRNANEKHYEINVIKDFFCGRDTKHRTHPYVA
jgi:hypothetical protein